MGIISNLFAADAGARDATDPRWWTDLGMSQKTQSGIDVNPSRALTLSTYFTCATAISSDLAKCPVAFFEEVSETEKRPVPWSREMQIVGRAWNPEMSKHTCVKLLTFWALTWGNGYAQIQRTGAGEVVALWPIHPRGVEVRRNRETREIEYVVRPEGSGQTTILSQYEMLHVKGPSDNGITGLSIAQLAAQAIGLGLAAEQFGASLFGNGCVPKTVIEYPGKLSPEGKEELRRRWIERHGNNQNWQSPAIIDNGVKVTTLNMPAEDAQFILTREHQVEDICRWFRFPPSKAMHWKYSHYANMEQANTDYATDCIGPWGVAIESEVDRDILVHPVRIEFRLDALMRGDSPARAAYYREMWNTAAITPNEIRARENLPSLGPDGDKPYRPLNMAPVGDPLPEQRGTATDRSRAEAAFRPLILDAYARAWARMAKDLSAGKSITECRSAQTAKTATAIAPIMAAYAQVTDVVTPDAADVAARAFDGFAVAGNLTKEEYLNQTAAFADNAAKLTFEEITKCSTV